MGVTSDAVRRDRIFSWLVVFFGVRVTVAVGVLITSTRRVLGGDTDLPPSFADVRRFIDGRSSRVTCESDRASADAVGARFSFVARRSVLSCSSDLRSDAGFEPGLCSRADVVRRSSADGVVGEPRA